jgi:hypothetical protein
MLDAIAQVDNLGMEDSTLAADASTTSLDTNAALSESQGSSMQQTDFNQSMTSMLSTLDATASTLNPSLKIVSGQSLQAALADAIPGLDPTTITPPAPLAQGSSLKTSTTAAPSQPDQLGSLGEKFQTVSDGFEDLSNSFEQLATSFLGKDNFNSTAIGGKNDDADADADLGVENIGGDAVVDIHSGKHSGKRSDHHSNKVAIANDADADGKDGKMKVAIGGKNTDKMAIADNADNADDAADTVNAGFGISNISNDNSDADFGVNNINFDALKVNVDQVSQGLQLLIQQLEAAFESDSSAPTTEMLTSVTQ